MGVLDLSELERELTGGGNYSAKESSEAKLKQLVENESSSNASGVLEPSASELNSQTQENFSFDNINLEEIAAKVKASLQASEDQALAKKRDIKSSESLQMRQL